jgi:phosphatidylglycerophosphate synthase
MNSSRKLPKRLECPLDNVLLDVVEYINPYFYQLGFTPNGITTLSAIFGIIASLNIIYNWYILASINYFIGYFFDCMDGNYARRYKLTSKFGDLYDHIKDIVVSFGLMGVLISKHGFTPFTSSLSILFFALFGMNNLYLGEQERYFEGERSDFLKYFTMKSNFSLDFLRYFGCATVNAYVSTSILLLRLCN